MDGANTKSGAVARDDCRPGGRALDEQDEEDEETRQRRIEEELSRRDVSIVTVPKRRLYLLNPNPPEEEAI